MLLAATEDRLGNVGTNEFGTTRSMTIGTTCKDRPTRIAAFRRFVVAALAPVTIVLAMLQTAPPARSQDDDDVLLGLLPVIAVAAKRANLGATSLPPLKLLTIGGQNLDPAGTFGVRFFDRRGFDVEVPTIEVGATSLTVAVPPFFNSTTGVFSGGTVDVQVVQTIGGATRGIDVIPGFRIKALERPSATPGFVAIAVLEALAVFAPDIRATLSTLEGPEAADVLIALDAYETKVDALRIAVITVIQSPGQTVTIGGFDGTALVVDHASLVVLDRLMANFLTTFLPNSPGKCTNDPTLTQLLTSTGSLSAQRGNARTFYGACLDTGITTAVETLTNLTKAVGTGLLGLSAICVISTAGVCGVPAAVVGLVGGVLIIQSNAIAAQLLMVKKMVSTELTKAESKTLRQSLIGLQERIYMPFVNLGLNRFQKGSGLVRSLLLRFKDSQVDTTTFTASADIDAIFVTPGEMAVTPSGGLNAAGTEGGPFTPSSRSYTVTNSGGQDIAVAVYKTAGWLSLSTTGFALAAGASTGVQVAINSNAASLNPASYSDTVNFTNTTNGAGNTSRAASLMVEAATLDWVFNANYTADGIDFACSSIAFALPAAGGSANFAYDVANVTVTVDVPGLSFSVGGFGNLNVFDTTCIGTGGGGSAIAETATSYSTNGTISGSGTCTDSFGSFPVTVTGGYSASAAK